MHGKRHLCKVLGITNYFASQETARFRCRTRTSASQYLFHPPTSLDTNPTADTPWLPEQPSCVQKKKRGKQADGVVSPSTFYRPLPVRLQSPGARHESRTADASPRRTG